MNRTQAIERILELAPLGATFGDGPFGEPRIYRRTLTRSLYSDDEASVTTPPTEDEIEGRIPVLYCGYNPSTADETVDDPTIRRELHFGRRVGGTFMVKVNMFDFRSTDPKNIGQIELPGKVDKSRTQIYHVPRDTKDNMDLIRELGNLVHAAAGTCIAAWGSPKGYKDTKARAKMLHNILISTNEFPWWCLGTTGAGYPRHPLYLPNETRKLLYRNPSR